jgi:glycosyl transferase family 2
MTMTETMSSPTPPDPVVTCILTAYNFAPYIERAIASVLGQHGFAPGEIEILAIDDGSTDGTLELLEAMGPPVRVIRQQRRGPAVGTNRGIAEARGRYVGLLDGDDEWLPDKLARQIAVLEARPEVGLVYGDLEVIDGAGRVVKPSFFAWAGQTPVVGRVLGRLLAQNYAGAPMLLRTEVARAVPPAPDWAWCRDYWLASHVAQEHELDCVLEPVIRYRRHDTNISAVNGGDVEKTLRLLHRDVRIRRIFMRELDLASASVDELAVAWASFGRLVEQVARGLRVDQAEIVPVSGDDRAAAAASLRAARADLALDPAAAASHALRALAADPFGADGWPLLAEARRRARASGARPPLRSLAHADRLRDLAARRAAVLDATGLTARLGAYERFESLRRVLAASPGGDPPAAPTDDRDRAIDALAAGLYDAERGDHAGAAASFAAAAVHDPGCEPARLALDDALAALGGQPSRRSPVPPSPAPRPELDGAGAFVGLAFADELVADPALLAVWVAHIDEDDDATLAIYAPGRDEAGVVAALGPAFAAAGIGEDDGRDLVAVVGPATPELEAGLACDAHVLLTKAPPPAAFAAVPAGAGPQLRELAERRWAHGGVGRPIDVAIKVCQARWDGTTRSVDRDLADALVAELRRCGHRPIVQVAEEWYDARGRSCDVAVHLRGAWPYLPRDGELSVLWPAGAPAPTTREAARYDCVLDSPATVSAGVDALLRSLASLVPSGAPSRA